ncbi:hypothetical protein COM64_20815 [Bacillus toyonensis]|nr:hypothetical protein COM64_20815 [Bacillus toyonensis]
MYPKTIITYEWIHEKDKCILLYILLFFYRKLKDGFIINAVKSTFYKSFKYTGLRGYKDTKIQGYKDTRIQRYKDTKIHVSFLFLGVYA